MRAFGMLPSDPRVREMNIFQWLWCYYNLVEDEKEEQEVLKIHLDRLAFIVNPEVAKKVFEFEDRTKRTGKNGKVDSRPIGSTEFRPDEAVHQNDDFDLEFIAASKGYDPDSGKTVQEFLQELADKKEVDPINDSFDDLLASGEFHEVVDTSYGAGDPNETFDDFFSRVLQFRDENLKSVDENEIPIGIENPVESSINEQNSSEDLNKVLEKYGLTEDDLDIVDFDGE